ncbi:response regulator [Methanococcoides sp. SA1]|nr:response regulator [Methanococcoides sp. SA1]
MPNILVVEDNPMNMELVTYLLTTNGIDVVQAFNGFDALEKVQTTIFDLILLDIQLPGIDGIEVLRRIKEELKLTDIAVVALTAHAMKGDSKHFIEAGCIGYISKPIDVSIFMDQVHVFLEH